MNLDQPPLQKTPEETSFLIADCGSAHTAVSLFDQAIGSYRLVGRSFVPTTTGAPWLDIMEGVQQGIRRLTEATGRTLIGDTGKLVRPARQNGSGIDEFGAAISAGEPLSTLIVGLFDDVSIASARRALHTIYAHEIDCISLSDTRTEAEQVGAILKHQPDLIFITGGTDGGAENRLKRLVETVSLGIHVLAGIKRPQVLFAGNRQLREYVRQKLGTYANVQVANNLRPTLQVEDLSDAARLLAELYEDIKISKLPGVQELREWATFPVVTPARAFQKTAEYFANLYKGAILGVDLGANSLGLVEATTEHSALYLDSELGMGQPIANLLTAVSPETIANYLPIDVTPEVVANFVYNKEINPRSIAVTDGEVQIEQALARAMIRHVAARSGLGKRAGGYRLLLARGNTLTQTARPGQALLTLLNTFTPEGVFAVALDKYGVLPALGAMASQQPLAVVQALESGVLVDLGWVIAPTGRGQTGQKAVSVVMESAGSSRLEIEVPFGSLEVLPLAPGHQATVTVQPDKRFDIGYGPGKSKKMTLRGGSVGIVIDARGRPLRYPADDQLRRNLIRQWLWDMGG